ncbi:DUF1801 domain-containing protein [Pedobacter polaris]|uniref:DUF1801 domain-containing protein n=1 Tax=Pedobacter polaris TaxID=2571273 RepID=A0A4V5P2Z8_9SPHI|nr:DUF1801 domain-containing protein [Pedobacter polaris]TKC10372.1 DUF1801 domain-containing protein [Pedobacter polaris]
MLSDLDNFYLRYEEPTRGCLLTLRDVILKHNVNITAEWKYKLPFFCFKGKMLCYLWLHKKYKKPYIGFVDGNLIKHEDLLQEKRARMKILLIDENSNLPIEKINDILASAIYICTTKN